MCDGVGMFITFEGLDGAGKSTQIRRIEARLQALGQQVLCTREPGGTATGDRVRQLLLDPESTILGETEVLLYAASRAQLVREVLRPALARGETILCDRYVDASLAYQGAGLGLGVAEVARVNHFATGGLQADLTFLFDVPVAVSQVRVVDSRRGAQADRIEQRSTAYFSAVREQFLAIAQGAPERVQIVDATRPEGDIEQEIWAAITKRIGTR